jgi:hypothetical protein
MTAATKTQATPPPSAWRPYPTCAERIAEQWKRTSATLAALYTPHDMDPGDLRRELEDIGATMTGDEDHDDLNDIAQAMQDEYGLDFCFTPGEDGERGYWCYLLSTGGPHDDVRFWADYDGAMHYAEYHFMDWYDGAQIEVTKHPAVREMWECLRESGAVEHEYQAMTDKLNRHIRKF